MFRAGLDARVPTNDRQTLAMQNLGHAGVCRPLRLDGRLPSPGGELWRAAARVPREATGSRSPTGDRCGVRLASGSLGPLGNGSAGAPSGTGASGFGSLTEALDLTTPAGRAMAGLLAIFAEFEREILREQTRAGLAHARENGKRLGRPATALIHAAEIRKLHCAGIGKSEIARRVRIGRTSVRRILATERANRRRAKRFLWS